MKKKVWMLGMAAVLVFVLCGCGDHAESDGEKETVADGSSPGGTDRQSKEEDEPGDVTDGSGDAEDVSGDANDEPGDTEDQPGGTGDSAGNPDGTTEPETDRETQGEDKTKEDPPLSDSLTGIYQTSENPGYGFTQLDITKSRDGSIQVQLSYEGYGDTYVHYANEDSIGTFSDVLDYTSGEGIGYIIGSVSLSRSGNTITMTFRNDDSRGGGVWQAVYTKVRDY